MNDSALIVPITLFCLYSSVGIYVCAQIVILLWQRHRPFHYKAVFNWFALAWMLLRSVFWGMTAANAQWNGFLQNFVFWLPACLNFLTFATLALFLSKGIMPADMWRQKMRMRMLVVFTLCAVIDVAGSATLSALSATATNNWVGQLYSDGDAVFTAVLFAFLGAIFV